jgi:hypothetical protein
VVVHPKWNHRIDAVGVRVGIGIFLAAMAGHGSEVVIVSVMLAAFAWGIGYGCRVLA